jgi:dihydroorotate dehydrogenase (NAD+) catalytic subunit
MADMSVNIAGVTIKNPVIAASGTFGFGEEAALYMDVSRLGAVTLKALTREKRLGNPPPRIAETASGVLNSVGLQNPGVDGFLEKIYPRADKIGTVKIANIAGAATDDYVYVAERLNDTSIELYELNVSCPNVKKGGMSIGTDAAAIEELVGRVKKVAAKPVIVKLTPNVTNIVDMARAAKNGGADALSLINTLAGMAVNPYTRRPVMANVTGGCRGRR